MAESDTVEVRIVAASLAELQAFLGVGDLVPAGRIVVADGVQLDDVQVVKSSGFDGTQYVVEAVVTIVSTVTSGVPTAWLNDRLRAHSKVSATVDGEDAADPSDDG